MTTAAVTFCSLCLGGANITLPDKPLALEGFEFITDCGELASFVPLLPHDSEHCLLAQTIASICGCPKRQDACYLCQDDGSPGVAFPGRELGFLSEMYGGITPTCELVETGLHSYSREDPICSNSQTLLSQYCGCGADPTSTAFTPESECRLCPGGDQVPNADKELGFTDFPLRTCGQLEEAGRLLYANPPYGGSTEMFDNGCWAIQLLNQHCGCEAFHEDPCPICGVSGEYNPPDPDKIVAADSSGGSLLTLFSGGIDMGPISCGLLADISQVFAQSVDHIEDEMWNTGRKMIQGVAVQNVDVLCQLEAFAAFVGMRI